MEFAKIAKTFERLEKTSKRLEKILILRDFLNENPKEAPIIFDMIAGNYQRDINKKTLGISLKTIFAVLSFISRSREAEIEKKFNKIGDVGEVAKEILKTKKQSSLYSKELELMNIRKALDDISKTTGTNSNKRKKEILSNLFLAAQKPIEYKFLARLLIDDLRIGASEGVLREAAVNSLFPQILEIHLVCEKCGYVNLNMKKCFNCSSELDQKYQYSIASKKYNVVGLETPKGENSLKDFDIDYEINTIEFALRRNRETQMLATIAPRDLYNSFLLLFERKYNILNSFTKILKELDENLSNVLNFQIIVGTPIRSMLGTRTNTVTQSFEVVDKPAFLDFKYDGLRTQIHNDKGKITIFTRNLDNITKQFPDVVEFIKENFPQEQFVIDSECIGYDFKKQKFLPFQVLSRRILTKELDTVSHINVVVKAFDILYLNGETLIDMKYKDRREKLKELMLNRPLKQKMHFDVEMLKNINRN